MKNIDNDFSRFVDSYKIPTIHLNAGSKATAVKKPVAETKVDFESGNPKFNDTTPEYTGPVITPSITVEDVEDATGGLDWSNLEDRAKILDSQQSAESNYNPNAESNLHREKKYRAKGVAQFMDNTWKEAIRRGWVAKDSLPTDPEAASHAQYKYMDWIYQRPYISGATTPGRRTERALAAYNAGIGNVQKAVNAATESGDQSKWMDYMSLAGDSKYKEVSAYVPKIIARASQTDYKPTRKWDFSRKFGGILYKQKH